MKPRCTLPTTTQGPHRKLLPEHNLELEERNWIWGDNTGWNYEDNV